MTKTAYVMIRPEPKFRRDAFVAGLRRCGFVVVVDLPASQLPALSPDDVLVCWTVHRGRYGALLDQAREAGATVLAVENGYLAKDPFWMSDHFAIARDDHNGAGWWPYCDDPRPPEWRWTALDIPLQPWRPQTDGGHIVVREQRGIGSARMASPPGWHDSMVRRLRREQGRPVRLRKHSGLKKPDIPLLADLENCHCVVTWASSLAVRATVLGIPVFFAASCHVLAPIRLGWSKRRHGAMPYKGLRDLEFLDPGLGYINSHLQPGRLPALCRMAWAQWSCDEIAHGMPFDFLLADDLSSNRKAAS